MLFRQSMDASRDIEGMLSTLSIAVIDLMLSFQAQRKLHGHMVEFGVFRGRSAAVLGTHVLPGERLVLVDPVDQMERDKLLAICPGTEFVIATAETLPTRLGDYASLRDRCRLVHIDASHQFEPTFRELGVAEDLLGAGGLIVLDDYTNLNYSQNIAAIFKYLFTTKTRLTPCLVTEEKAYLCQRDDFETYARFLLDNAAAGMAARGIDACLARTDSHPEYGAFHLRPRLPGETGDFYGYDIYKRFYTAHSLRHHPAESLRRFLPAPVIAAARFVRNLARH